MDEQLIVFIKDQEQPVVFTPDEMRTGSGGYVSGKADDGTDVQFAISSIERMGAVS